MGVEVVNTMNRVNAQAGSACAFMELLPMRFTELTRRHVLAE